MVLNHKTFFLPLVIDLRPSVCACMSVFRDMSVNIISFSHFLCAVYCHPPLVCHGLILAAFVMNVEDLPLSFDPLVGNRPDPHDSFMFNRLAVGESSQPNSSTVSWHKES